MNQAENIAGYLEQFYRVSEYPALIRQVEEFRNSGVFRNRIVVVEEQPLVAGDLILIVKAEDSGNLHPDRTRHAVAAGRTGDRQAFPVRRQRQIQRFSGSGGFLSLRL